MGAHTVGRMDETGAFTWTHSDHLSSASAATDTLGAIVWRESYLPFGEAIEDPGANRDEAGFTGHIRDAATGLTYAQARYYNPVTARFLAPDPVGFASGGAGYFNRYAYTMNDPVNATDPTGMFQERQRAANPVDGGHMRDDDAGGGHYGAARGARQHNGLDIVVEAGADISAPISGTIRIITAVYANDDPDFDGIEITGNGDDQENQSVKLFYVDASVANGDEVAQGDIIGTAQDVGGHYGGDMENHVHMEQRIDGEVVDPNSDLEIEEE